MDAPQFLKIDKEDYVRIAKALVVFDHIRHRNSGSEDEASEVSDLQERWLGDADRFGLAISEDERGSLVDAAYDEVDEFVEGETWHELAWWLAERECKRLSVGVDDKEARTLVTDRIYHEFMEEFVAHGIDRIQVPGIPADRLPVRKVLEALRIIKAETKGLAAPGAGRDRDDET